VQIYNLLQKEIIMNIYVGNLSHEVTEEDLRLAFEPFGQVESATIIKDKHSGQSKGFGFVEMASKAEGQWQMRTKARPQLLIVDIHIRTSKIFLDPSNATLRHTIYTFSSVNN
jgi:RNA recognition motif-containing protein